MDCLDKSDLHALSKVFDLLQTGLGLAPYIVLFAQPLGLRRAQVPGAYKWPLETIQPASVRSGVSATFAAPAEQLTVRHENGGQMEKEQIFKIDPHAGVSAADVGASGAGEAAQAIHEWEYRCQLCQNEMRQPARFFQGLPAAVKQMLKAGIGLKPKDRGVPGNG